MKSKTQEKLEKLKVKPKISGIKLKNKREEKDYSYLNKKLEKYYDVRAETAYYFDVEYTINKKFADEYNHGETKMKNEIGPIFEVDGKWYSSHVIETVGNLID